MKWESEATSIDGPKERHIFDSTAGHLFFKDPLNPKLKFNAVISAGRLFHDQNDVSD